MSEDTERVSVRTYVPSYQRDVWDEDAEAMEMSRSEYVRTMVQAGRRDFDLDSSEPQSRDPSNESPNLESQVLDLISSKSAAEFDEILAYLTQDIEDQLDEALEALQSRNSIKYSSRKGGFTRMEAGNE